MKRILGIAAAGVGLMGFARAASAAEVSGVVVDALTGRAVDGASVSLSVTQRPAKVPIVPYLYLASPRIGGVRTDRQGRFVLRNVAAGTYLIHAAHEAYGSPRFVEGDAIRLDTPFRVEPGRSREGITIRLVPSSEIRGKVTREDGSPLPGARVYLISKSRDLSTDSDESDAEGNYVFSQLFPGDYVIQANPPAELAAAAGLAYGLAFHGGSGSANRPRVLSLAEGGRLAGIDVVARPSAAQVVRGRLETTGKMREARVELRPLLEDPSEILRPRSGSPTPDGGFEFRQVAPGRYVVKARATEAVWSMTGERESRVSAEQVVEVTAAGALRVSLKLRPALKVRGRVRLEGGGIPHQEGLSFSFRGREMPWRAYGISTKADAAFQMEIPPDGAYAVALQSGRGNLYLKAVMVNGRMQPAQEVRFPAGEREAEAELVLGRAGAQMETQRSAQVSTGALLAAASVE